MSKSRKMPFKNSERKKAQRNQSARTDFLREGNINKPMQQSISERDAYSCREL